MELTERRRQVAEMLVQGKSRKEIGTALGISEFTVKNHADALRRILGVERARQIPWAYQQLNGGTHETS
jgi:DNA-binding NarL/FixJ family response regulator